MAPHMCEMCTTTRAQILRPKNRARLCAACFTRLFEDEVSETITTHGLFQPGERVAIGASGGKDSTVLAAVLQTLNARHGWGLNLLLLSVDEGIQGYRDHSLEAVRRNSAELALPLHIVSYAELYGWSMDQVVAQVGKKGNCTYCGVFRRQALDRGAAVLGVEHVVTGHNADDVAETVVMNLLRGDLPRLGRATSIITTTPGAVAAASNGGDRAASFTNVKRSKPLMYAYEKEIVLYAHHKKLDYFSTECIYSPEAFRGSARTLIKNLERIRPESILDIVRSGMDMAKLVPHSTENGESGASHIDPADQRCGGNHGRSEDDGMAEMEKKLRQDEVAAAQGLETEIKIQAGIPTSVVSTRHDDDISPASSQGSILDEIPIRTKQERRSTRKPARGTLPPAQKLGHCERCGYLSSQAVCKACVLLEGLNKARPHTTIEVQDAGG